MTKKPKLIGCVGHDCAACKKRHKAIDALRYAMQRAKHQIELQQSGFAKDILDRALYPEAYRKVKP